jgi:hypothetical protein
LRAAPQSPFAQTVACVACRSLVLCQVLRQMLRLKLQTALWQVPRPMPQLVTQKND